ncbi:hypothetical protein SAMD00019534_117890 [Acytostelium subglobosum LB1]|uniref:hypothetical protein n=1 Tax=Acytostelium subglobosum LB1 TaxID=1410327 RepID=UPI0006447F49|nr:hypothetical protein SAMD00019534_117890 [Acytostelium subglobosum LB1]GAM28613.1 hypothetical protein SAMD00019534_117890 [Acytostelium subglobosum LB1]|eukprot:XP_012748391.1 hypothetical protein SAMD00019534_117890 [Acytostelium subglobosum LB1]
MSGSANSPSLNAQPPKPAWVKSSKNTITSNIDSLSAFLQKQSASKKIEPNRPKTYKKKWCWFQQDSGCLYYHHAGALNSAGESGTPLSIGYQIKTIHIEHCQIEQSTTTRLEFIITSTIPQPLQQQQQQRRQWVWRAVDEQTVLQWVNGLTLWKQRNLASSANASRRSTMAGLNPLLSQAPQPVTGAASGSPLASSNGSSASGTDSPPLSPAMEHVSPVIDRNKAIAEQFLKSLSINCDAGLDRASGKFGAVKIRQLLVRQTPPLDSDQTNYILSLLQSQISFLQECHDEIQLFGDNGNSNGNRRSGHAPANKQQASAATAAAATPVTPSGKTGKTSPTPAPLSPSNSYSNLEQADDDDDDNQVKEDNVFSLLPNHLSLYILSYLEPKQLLLCGQVSSHWRLLSGSNALWQRFTQHLQTPASIFDTTQNWKATYLNHVKQSSTTKEKIMSRALSIYGLQPVNSGKSVKEGFLYKRGEDILRIWKKRYFVLKENCLFYFQHPSDNFPCGMIPLHVSFRVKRVSPSTRKHCFKVIHDGLQSCKQISDGGGGGRKVERKEPYYLSAESDEECNVWLATIQNAIQKSDKCWTTTKVSVTGQHSNQHRSYSTKLTHSFNKGHFKKASNSTPITPSSLAGDPPLSPKSSSVVETRPLFGLPLSVLMADQVKHNVDLPMPYLLFKCFEHIQQYGLQEEGLFRVSGSVLEIEALKITFEQNTNFADVDLSQSDIHAVTGLVKSFFRKLPGSLMPQDLDEYATTVSMAQSQTQEQKINEYKFIFDSLDPVVYSIFRSLLFLLKQTVDNKSCTKMTEENILIVIMPTLKCKPVLINNGIRYYNMIFGNSNSNNNNNSSSGSGSGNNNGSEAMDDS